ncbi:MAG: hypothetical protein KatS3mg085_125 [Candidatus Dojkabacteria bacterium]|nr:MAG: hypothetical protein KatS3mg085_125 [Candidatus Dojkabacteria bacterium]
MAEKMSQSSDTTPNNLQKGESSVRGQERTDPAKRMEEISSETHNKVNNRQDEEEQHDEGDKLPEEILLSVQNLLNLLKGEYEAISGQSFNDEQSRENAVVESISNDKGKMSQFVQGLKSLELLLKDNIYLLHSNSKSIKLEDLLNEMNLYILRDVKIQNGGKFFRKNRNLEEGYSAFYLLLDKAINQNEISSETYSAMYTKLPKLIEWLYTKDRASSEQEKPSNIFEVIENFSENFSSFDTIDSDELSSTLSVMFNYLKTSISSLDFETLVESKEKDLKKLYEQTKTRGIGFIVLPFKVLSLFRKNSRFFALGLSYEQEQKIIYILNFLEEIITTYFKKNFGLYQPSEFREKFYIYKNTQEQNQINKYLNDNKFVSTLFWFRIFEDESYSLNSNYWEIIDSALNSYLTPKKNRRFFLRRKSAPKIGDFEGLFTNPRIRGMFDIFSKSLDLSYSNEEASTISNKIKDTREFFNYLCHCVKESSGSGLSFDKLLSASFDEIMGFELDADIYTLLEVAEDNLYIIFRRFVENMNSGFQNGQEVESKFAELTEIANMMEVLIKMLYIYANQSNKLEVVKECELKMNGLLEGFKQWLTSPYNKLYFLLAIENPDQIKSYENPEIILNSIGIFNEIRKRLSSSELYSTNDTEDVIRRKDYVEAINENSVFVKNKLKELADLLLFINKNKKLNPDILYNSLKWMSLIFDSFVSSENFDYNYNFNSLFDTICKKLEIQETPEYAALRLVFNLYLIEKISKENNYNTISNPGSFELVNNPFNYFRLAYNVASSVWYRNGKPHLTQTDKAYLCILLTRLDSQTHGNVSLLSESVINDNSEVMEQIKNFKSVFNSYNDNDRKLIDHLLRYQDETIPDNFSRAGMFLIFLLTSKIKHYSVIIDSFFLEKIALLLKIHQEEAKPNSVFNQLIDTIGDIKKYHSILRYFTNINSLFFIVPNVSGLSDKDTKRVKLLEFLRRVNKSESYDDLVNDDKSAISKAVSMSGLQGILNIQEEDAKALAYQILKFISTNLPSMNMQLQQQVL